MKLFSVTVTAAALAACQLFSTVQAENDNYFWNTLDEGDGTIVGRGPITGILQDIEGLTTWSLKQDY